MGISDFITKIVCKSLICATYVYFLIMADRKKGALVLMNLMHHVEKIFALNWLNLLLISTWMSIKYYNIIHNKNSTK